MQHNSHDVFMYHSYSLIRIIILLYVPLLIGSIIVDFRSKAVPKKSNDLQTLQKLAKQRKPGKASSHILQDPRLLFNVKGHQSRVQCSVLVPVSSSQQQHTGAELIPESLLLSASSDRCVRLTRLEKQQESASNALLSYTQITLKGEAASKLAVSPGFAVALLEDTDRVQCLTFNSVNGTDLQLAHVFDSKHESDVVDVAVNSNSSIIMTCAGGSDTTIHFWSRDARLLHTLTTNRVQNFHAVYDLGLVFVAVQFGSPCAWSVEPSSKSFVRKAMELKAQSMSGTLHVRWIAVAHQSRHVAAVYEDGTVQMWDVDVRHEVNEDPKPLQQFSLPNIPHEVMLTPDASVLVFSVSTSIVFIRTRDGQLIDQIDEAHANDIANLRLSNDGKRVLTCGDRFSRVWKVPSRQS